MPRLEEHSPQSIKRSVAQMLQGGASEQEIDLYLSTYGMTAQDLPVSDKYTMGRAGYQTLGGMMGGVTAAEFGVTAPAIPAAVGLGSAIGGQIYDLTKEHRGEKVPETLAERAKSAQADFLLDVVSPAAINAGIYGVKKTFGYIGQKAKKAFKPAEYWVYKKFGVEPSAATATRSKGLAVAEHALGDFPMTSDILQTHAQKNIEELTIANRYLAQEYGPILSKEEIGVLLKKASPGVLDKYSTIYDKLFSRVSEDINTALAKSAFTKQKFGIPREVHSAVIPIKNTVGMLKTIIGESKLGPTSGVGKLAQELIRKAKSAGGGLTWNAIKKHRTKIGDMMRDPALVSTRNIQSGDLKRLYAALTQDMEAAAMAAGPKTHAKWRAANKYFEIKLTRDIPIIEDIIKKQYPEEVFDIVMRSSKKGGSRLRLLRKQLSPKEWDAIAGTVLGKLGVETAGAGTTLEPMFSPSTFMTRWKGLSEPAKRQLFKGTRYAKLVPELNDFVRVAGDMKAVEKLANTSRTGSVLMFFGLWQSGASALGGATGAALGGVGGAAVGAGSFYASSIAVPRLTAKLLVNPKFVRWLNQGIKIAKHNPNAMSTHLGRLMYLRFREDIQEDVDNIITSFLGE
jgi:hypothetical protein